MGIVTNSPNPSLMKLPLIKSASEVIRKPFMLYIVAGIPATIYNINSLPYIVGDQELPITSSISSVYNNDHRSTDR